MSHFAAAGLPVRQTNTRQQTADHQQDDQNRQEHTATALFHFFFMFIVVFKVVGFPWDRRLLPTVLAINGTALRPIGIRLFAFFLRDTGIIFSFGYRTARRNRPLGGGWENPDGRVVRTLRVEAGYSDEPREVCLYYTNRAGEDFSQDKRVFPQKQADGSYRYTLPYGAIASLRLDPCSPDVNKSIAITLGVVTMNEPAGAGSYFVPSWYQCFGLILYPGLAAAALSLARQAWKKRR